MSKEVLSHPESRIYCGLLTSLYHSSSVHADWKNIAAEHGLDRERFVLIPKDSLDADKRTFLALLKLAIMNGTANALRKAVRESFKSCLDESDVELSKLDVFEFERIICLTSSAEGVWEPDTLLRIFSLFHKKFVRKRLHTDNAGSYDGSHLDTVNLMNGNLMLHAPLVPDLAQRGALSLHETLYVTSKDWQAGVNLCLQD